MKYKDFKMMSKEGMKNVKGGDAPLNQMVCTCGSNTIACGYNTNQGAENCFNMAADYCRTHNGGPYMDCTGSPQ